MVAYQNPAKDFLGKLSQASRAVRTRFDQELRSRELTLPRGRVLLHLVSAQHVVTQSELADVLEVEHPTIVRLLDGLEQLGHVERQPVRGDRRVKAVVLTGDGRRIALNILGMTDELSEKLLEGVDPRDLAAAARVLARLSDNIQQSAAPRAAMEAQP